MNFISKILFVGCLSLANLVLAAPLEQALNALQEGKTALAIDLLESQKSNPEAMLHLAKIYMRTDIDEAEEWIIKAVKKRPDDAESQYILGRIMGIQASSSIFSALSYAGKSLGGFTRAVDLKPDSLRYRNALVQFHIQAPSIAGGDLKIAKQQIEEIKQLNLAAGLKSEIDFYLSQDDDKTAEQLLVLAKQTFADTPDFFFKAGLLYQKQENYIQANAEFVQAINKPAVTEQSIKDRYNALYQLGRTAVLSKSNLQSGIQSLNEYIAQATISDGMPPKIWAEFRLANLLALNAQESEAKAIYLRLAKTSDEELVEQAKKAAKQL